MSLALTLTDNLDGTATATISGSAGGVVNLYSQPPGEDWTSRGTRVGDGTIGPVAMANGTYWWKATATTTGTGSPGNDEIIDVGPAVTLSGEGVEPRICMMDSTHAIVIYDYGSHPRPLKARGASLAADGRWTLGSEITVVTTSYGYHKICRMTDAKAIVVYDSAGGSLKAKCLSLSGVTVSAGAELAVSSASVAVYPDVERMDDDKGIVAYGSSGSIGLKCLTISGTTLSAGAAATISDATYNAVALASLTSASATLAAKTSAGVLTAAAVALSGTTITTGTAITVDTGITGNICSDGLSSTKSILCWKAGTGYTSGAVLTVSGTDISAGTTATSTDTATTGISSVTALSASVALSLTAGTNGGTIRSATISGTAITWGTGNAVAGISGGNCVQTDIDAISSTRAVLSCSINYPIAQEITYIPAVAAVAGTDTVQTSPVVYQPIYADGVRITDLCDALVEYLNTSVLAGITATRGYWLDTDAINLDTTAVFIRPADNFANINTGLQTVSTDYTLNIAVVARAEDDAAVDELLGILQDIEEQTRTQTIAKAKRSGANSPVTFDTEYLREKRVFRGMLSLKYRVVE